MAPAKRRSNTQQNGRGGTRQAASNQQQGASGAPAARTPRASAAKATAAARSGSAPRAGRAAAPTPETPAAYYGGAGQRFGGGLDEGARRQVTGVAVAVLGVALLIAVLTPTSGVLTQAVSTGLHAVLGLGAFLLPAGLLLWSVTFFLRTPQVVPGRVAVGLALVALAVMGIVGITTPGADLDTARLFNSYILADRGGYVGNGLAWLLLTLTGKVVGLVVLVGLAVAGLVVVGLNFTQAIGDAWATLRQRAAFRRVRADERAAAARAQQQASAAQQRVASGWGVAATPVGSQPFPQDYAPTALFDPTRPIAPAQRAGNAPATFMQSAAPTSYVQAGQTTYLPQDHPWDAGAAGAPGAAPSHFGCGDAPLGGKAAPGSGEACMMPGPEGEGFLDGSRRAGDLASAAQPHAPAVPAASYPARPASATCPATTVLPAADPAQMGAAPYGWTAPAQPVPGACAQPGAEAYAYVPAQPAVPAAFGAQPGVHSVPSRSVSRRARSASTWWDPKDDWNREDFDPNDLTPCSDGRYVPGVLPGAPTTYDDFEGDQVYVDASGVVFTVDDELEQTAARVAATPQRAMPASPAGAVRTGSQAASRPVPTRPAAADEDEAPEDEACYDPMGALTALEADAESAQDSVTRRTRAALASATMSAAPAAPARAKKAAAAQAQAREMSGEADEGVELPWETARVADAPTGDAPVYESVDFQLPDPGILERNTHGLERSAQENAEIEAMAVSLQRALTEFGVKAQVVDWICGPTCTTYEVSPGEGVRVNKFTALEDDIARTLACQSVRIYAPVPGTSYVGIEVPNKTRQAVLFGDVLPFVDGGPLDFAVGLDANGKPVHVDLAKLPHILIAGTTGSGKSVAVNCIVMSMLMRCTPDDVRLIMVDPKQVEFKDYNGVPHLIMPVVTDMRQAAAALQWGVAEMDRRYRVFSNLGVRDLERYNKLVDGPRGEDDGLPFTHLPSVVIVIDELADLMMVAKKDVEASIVRIAQLGRACGIHLVMATQSPRADVVTGLIRANVANRIGLKVAKKTDSQIAIDQPGAEKLLGHGDMLFLQTAWGDKPRRIQGCYLTDAEISQVVEHLKVQGAPRTDTQMAPLPGSQPVTDLSPEAAGASGASASGGEPQAGSDDDPLAWEAAALVVENQLGSTSMIQRRLKLGYARAGRVMDMLEEMGVVGPARGSKPRDVLIRDLDELATLRGGAMDTEGEY